jgi:hypothetical protein
MSQDAQPKPLHKKIYEEFCDTHDYRCKKCGHEWLSKEETSCEKCASDDVESSLKLDFYKTEFHYSWDEIVGDVKHATGPKEKLIGASKFAARALANTGLTLGKTSFFAAKHTLKNLPSITASIATSALDKGNGKLSDERTDRLKETVEKNKGRKLF